MGYDRVDCIAKSPMPYQCIEPGIKEAAIKTYERGLLPLKDILDVLTISHCTFYLLPAPQLSHWSDGAWVRGGANRSPKADSWFSMTQYLRFV